jgi:DNA-binding CsgD family transcriptional regulator
MSDDRSENRSNVAVLVLFALIGFLMLGDLLVDYREGVSLSHLLLESAVLAFAFAGGGIVVRGFRHARRAEARLTRDLQRARTQAAQWQKANEAYLRGLGEAIREQFSAWGFTAAESEVALLLIKGLSHREIAVLRDTSERTVRHQAQSAYRKADLPGRNALAAFFLEDLLPGG